MARVSSLFLSPLSVLYGAASSLRNKLYDKGLLGTHRSSLPVISVGNLTAGGSGKTPLCIFLAEALLERGHKPVILSRGYGGKLKGPHVVSPDDGFENVGDEPLLMARRKKFPVVICRKRVLGARYIEAQKLGSVIILDDGFQHRALSRDLDIVTINIGHRRAVQDFVAGRLLPAGGFRENRERALKRARAIVLASRNLDVPLEIAEEIKRFVSGNVPVFKSFLQVQAVCSLSGSQVLEPKPAVAFCGIANPEGFMGTLEALGYTCIAKYVFPDHYCYTRQDIERMQKAHPAVPLVCTEKDGIRLAGIASHRIFQLLVKTRVEPEEEFLALISRVLYRRAGMEGEPPAP